VGRVHGGVGKEEDAKACQIIRKKYGISKKEHMKNIRE
jgi:hypothetical protein